MDREPFTLFLSNFAKLFLCDYILHCYFTANVSMSSGSGLEWLKIQEPASDMLVVVKAFSIKLYTTVCKHVFLIL